MSQCQRWQPR